MGITYITIPLEDGSLVTYDCTNDRFLSAIESLILSSESMRRSIVSVSEEDLADIRETVREDLGE
jgi:hypothetical protein